MPSTRSESVSGARRLVWRLPTCREKRSRCRSTASASSWCRRRRRSIVKLPIKAGPHELGVTFVRKPPAGADDVWQIFAANSGVQSVAITGPLTPTGLGDTPSRQRIFVCHPQSEADEGAPGCAKRISRTVARRAFRQPVTDADLQTLIEFFEAGRKSGGFDAGIEQGLARVLVDPRFVFRLEREPANVDRRQALSSLGSRAGVAAVVLSLEQHSGRCAARRGDQGHAARASGARATDAAHAGRSQGAARW